MMSVLGFKEIFWLKETQRYTTGEYHIEFVKYNYVENMYTVYPWLHGPAIVTPKLLDIK